MAGIIGHFEEYSRRWPASVTKVGSRHQSEDIVKNLLLTRLSGWVRTPEAKRKPDEEV